MNIPCKDRSHSSSKNLPKKNSQIFIISAPSGCGKTTLCNVLRERMPDILYSISYTTRQMRNGEKEGVDYYFISTDKFEQGIKNKKWAEWANVHDNYYGTSAEFLEKGLASGHDVLLDIDVQGAAQLLIRYPDSVTIFILPPSIDILRQRLENRGTDSKEDIERRLIDAEKELVQKDLYRHIIVNDKLSTAVEELIAVVEQYKSRTDEKK